MPREVLVLVAVAFFVALGFGIVAPALPVFARHFGVGRAAAGAVISVFAFLRIGFALPAGRLVDRWGERLVLATGIAIVAVSSLLAGFAGSYQQLLVLRGAGGVGSAMFSISAMALLVRLVPADRRGRAVGLWSGGFLLGGISGPAVGGVVTGISLRLPFFIYAGTLAVAGSVALVLLRGTPLADRATATAAKPLTLPAALRLSGYRAALVANFADSWAALGVRSALVPLFVADVLHRSAEWTGIGFLVVAALNGAMLLPAGKMADSLGRKPVLAAGCATGAVGVALLAIWPSLAGYLIGLALLGIGSGLLDVAPAAMVADVVGGGRGGPVYAAYSMSSDIGSVVGPVAAGAVADASYADAFGMTAGILALAALVATASGETRGLGTANAAPLSPVPVPGLPADPPATPSRPTA